MTPKRESCTHCGADVQRIGEHHYSLHINGALHGCTAPSHHIPAATGEAMVFDDALGVLVPVGGAA